MTTGGGVVSLRLMGSQRVVRYHRVDAIMTPRPDTAEVPPRPRTGGLCQQITESVGALLTGRDDGWCPPEQLQPMWAEAAVGSSIATARERVPWADRTHSGPMARLCFADDPSRTQLPDRPLNKSAGTRMLR